MKTLIRKSVLAVNPYISGKPIEETKRQLGLKEVIKLASNENPLGPSPKALSAIKRSLSGVNRYPDAQGYYLKKRLAKFLGLSPENFVLGNGSDELIDVLIKTFMEADENIVTSEGTFLEYEIIAQVNDRKVKKAPLRYFKYDLGAMLKLVDKKTKLIFIANPNNPTGTYVTKYEIAEFIDALPEGVVVVFDEAYGAFIDVDDYPDSLSYLRKKKKIIILRTFSKAYGLAGLRLGYAIAAPELVTYMERIRQPFNVNLLAQVAGLAALGDNDFLKKTRRLILEGKDFIYRELAKMGLSYVLSVANFILVDTGKDGREVFKSMLKSGVIVRDMEQYGLRNFIRVTIGTQKENKKFLRVLGKVLTEDKP
ncbi:MAG: histidinol-phosphate transaminase [Candidatus Omnitrophica bacterium]|nr:histidinol-phosphate transaminase [Candidatus Omnitrophota bacterium]MBU4303402.1 histidinol-phosphate transaminase [Candidatus Omnitrophota bacterium]MBU4418530.1 histidinol-phosphate transaminase [Candidatus Omnitrophota bacterium]MBU4468788.1 histidinol-phosphate transaminase [Candidatus Omnitrophota bacterium]MCG2708075.1 histidinol-phosphate transaminase [Candidatus Omnitrophota bacterium]